MKQDISASFKQSTFSRSMLNEAKLGAYYTDPNHCRRLGRLFEWPQDESCEVCALEPSIGDGRAVLEVMKDCDNRQIFGVELNATTCQSIKDRKEFAYLLNEDFLNGVKISHSSFSFCFANPPYGKDQDSNERLEKLFIEKMFSYLKQDAVLCLVIPYYVLMEEKFMRCFMARFHPVAVFRFDDDVYKQFQQIVVIGRRRNGLGCMKKWLEQFREKVDSLEKLAYLPRLEVEVSEKIPVNPSFSKDIEYFTTLQFNAEEAGEYLEHSPLFSVIGEKGMPERYMATEIGRPPMPLKRDLLYLLSIAGGGQGLVGSAENHDLHLQRGTVKVETEAHVVPNQGETANRYDVVETSYNRISLNIIQNDGTVTVLS